MHNSQEKTTTNQTQGPQIEDKSENKKLSREWNYISKDYKLKKMIGAGQYGQVVKAKCRSSGKKVAIKMIKDIFDGSQLPKYVVRELQIMHELTKMPNNIFTVKLHDIVIPCESKNDLKSFDHIFIVMDLVEHDMQSLFKDNKPSEFTEEHLVYLLYNILCSINFLETANVMHRDLKPSNVLITEQCSVQICDFGFACTVPEDIQKSDDSDNQLLHLSNKSSGDENSDRKPRFLSNDSEEEKPKPSRQLTPHVFTRWYRPPEVILGQTDYDSKSDIWSVGCILSNLIQLHETFDKSVEAEQHIQSRKDKHLFHGNSCFPMSPDKTCRNKQTDKKNHITISEDDQLVKIIETLGRDNVDMSFIDDRDIKAYCQLVTDTVEYDQQKTLEKRYKASSQDIIELLTEMLQFNPHVRQSAGQLLKHKVFDSIRVPKIEEAAPYKVTLPQEKKLQAMTESTSDVQIAKQLRKCRKEIVKIADQYRKYS